MNSLSAGIVHELRYRVPLQRTVPFLYPEAAPFNAMPQVFATGYLVGLMEWACMEALAPYLTPSQRSVGTAVSITHCAPTPPGMMVTASVLCIEVNGRRALWEMRAHDEHELIGEGTHERVIIDLARFEEKVRTKTQAVKITGGKDK